MTARLSKTQVAYHEAGRAVVAIALGCPIRDVTIHDPSGGRIRPQKNFKVDTGLVAAIALAGLLAQRRRFPRSKWIEDSGWYSLTPGFYYWIVNEMMGKLIAGGYDGDEIIAWRIRVEKVVKELIAEHWNAIGRVAKALLEHGTLTGRQAKKIAQTEAAA
jgi:hypothetical protein